MYLIDTNVISEVRKGTRCDRNVAAWYGSIRDDELFLSVLVIGEIRQGVERRDHRQASAIERWLDEVVEAFGDRILPINERVAQRWGRMNARRVFPVIDSLLAATADVHGLTFATRNAADLAGSGVSCVNPFQRA